MQDSDEMRITFLRFSRVPRTGERSRSPRQVCRVSALSVIAVLVALGAARSSGAAREGTATAHGSRAVDCGAAKGRAPTISHVIWIWMENHSAGEIIGAPAASYVTELASRCGVATRYDAVAHPSLPNYIAATSGTTAGITDDGPPAEHPQLTVSLFEQAPSAASFEESMPSNCDLSDGYPYAAKHNPETYYLRLRKACALHDRPLGTPDKGPFAHALAGAGLPAFSFVTPNLCDDMHSCPVSTGDKWLARWVPAIVSSPSYRAGHTALFITWDENDGSAGNRVPLIVVSAAVQPGTRVSIPFTHYSLLRTTEELLGIRTYLGHAATATSMRTAFGL